MDQDAIPHFRSRSEYLRDHSTGDFRFSGTVTFFYEKEYTEARLTLDTKSGKTFYGEGLYHRHSDGLLDKAFSEQMSLTLAMQDALKDAELYLLEQTDDDDKPCCEQPGSCEHTALPGEAFTDDDRSALALFLGGFSRNEESDECDACHCDDSNDACTCGRSRRSDDRY